MEKEPKTTYKSPLKELSLELPKDYQTVCCPSCNTDIPATDLNIHDKVGKCVACNVLFPLQETIHQLVQTPISAEPKHTMLRPEGIDVFKFKEELELSFKLPLSAGLAIAILFLIFFAIAITAGYFSKDSSMPILVPMIFWSPLLIAIYRAIVGVTARITVDDRFLTIQQRRKRSKKEQNYAITDIDQVYVKKVKDSDTACTIHIIVNTLDGQKHINLLPPLNSYSKAKYLEQEIENHLGIVDRKVPGAL